MVIEPIESVALRGILLLPFLAAVIHGVLLAFLRRPLPRLGVIAISCGAVLGSLILSFVALFQLLSVEAERRLLLDTLYTWVGSGVGHGAFSADMAFQLDALSAVMCLVITGVGLLIHVYSIGYMDDDHRDDRGFQRFFCYLNLFTAAMLCLVLADNLLLLFLGWEGVGLCSYLLIGFWYSDSFNAYCGSKAFIVNRIGDFGFLCGLFLLFWGLSQVGTPAISFRAIEAAFPKLVELTVSVPAFLGGEWSLATLIGLCFFLGACGKSAQLPLYMWLPDAMAGPTPVSALIHAATMVTAGVYLVCRMSFLYAASPEASAVIAWVGGGTALFAATIAVAQNDIKKVLAYSTVSQLGYMFLAAGCGAYTAAMFHVVTHAFFKALLFMGAGAVIMAMHHEQDMRKMGGLKKQLKWTYRVMLAGTLAIAGIFPLSGFFSKDEILLAVFSTHEVPGHLWLYGIGLFTALLTAFYMGRLFFLTFHGESRVPRELRSQLADPASVVMWPLYVLAFLSITAAWLTLPQFWGDMMPFDVENSDSLGNFLQEVVVPAAPHAVSHATEWALIGAATAVAVAGLALAFLLYVRVPALPGRIAGAVAIAYRALLNKYYVDEAIDAVLVRPLVWLSDRVLFRFIDAVVVDGVAVNGTANAVRALAGSGLKHLQSGLTQGYLLLMVVGALVIVGFLLG
ncbi:MAG: NADH-quinone oxidoreductase subunit L [Proteobacteria bacterium]|nr:NADH-quinone oxidoreductase subunit L [Pseudomonadota bacterium]